MIINSKGILAQQKKKTIIDIESKNTKNTKKERVIVSNLTLRNLKAQISYMDVKTANDVIEQLLKNNNCWLITK